MSAETRLGVAAALAARTARPLKYRNQPVVVDGRSYSSKKEARRAGELALMHRAKQICDLAHQPRFPLVVDGTTVAHYVADFSYIRMSDGVKIIEDVKSPITRKNPLYRLKFKIMAAMGLHVVEV